ncbi:tRNA 2-thiouridine(34) synthase MnmA [Patescibacteria group bacterium]|nr:tRNA 2-thiouridine(34) synthase MnmA [Patescibacteria group bacterium]
MKFIRDKQNKKTVVAMSPRKSLRDSAGQAGEHKKRIAVAMSGGVDSSAVALLLKKQGYEVIGIFMRLAPLDMKNYLTGWSVNEEDNEAAARQVCQKLNIKFYPINLTQEFRKEVMDYFLDSYAQGLTPNPCVKCNQLIKFNGLLKLVEKLGADYLATGHYARLRREFSIFNFQFSNKSKIQNPKSQITAIEGKKTNIRYKLFRAADKNKDQSYFLYNLTQRQLARVLFPLGDYAKEEVRKIADRAKLPYLTKESQDICFLKGDHNDFLRQRLKLKPGPIILLRPSGTSSYKEEESEWLGKVIGEHQGLPLYTIGQRRGVEIGGIGPFYAAKCDYKTNTLYVASNGDDPVLYSDETTAKDVNWIAGQEPKMPLLCEAVIRYRHKPVKCEVKSCGNKYLIKFNKAQRAVTPGQSIVFYQGDEVLGGAVIHDTASI